jgi:hypothetical protein
MTETPTKRDVLKVTDDTTRQQFEVMLTALVFRAKREVPKCGDAEHKTPYDIYHERIDALLDELEMLG